MNEKYFINIPSNFIKKNLTNTILQQFDALEFHQSLAEYKPTPLIHLPNLARYYNIGNVYVKDESLRFGLNAFKVLGASFAIFHSLKKDPDIETFCTATDGNHGKAVAWSAKKFGKKSVVYVPRDTTSQRIEAIENEGARVIQINGNYDQTCKVADEKAKENNWSLIQDAAWDGYIEIPALIMAGYKTIFKEIEDYFENGINKNIHIVFLQAGVGSMAASAIYYFLQKFGDKRPKIVIVEPNEADGILLTFKNNKISTSLGSSKTIMAGLNCETPSIGAWSLIRNGTDYSIKICDKRVIQAIREFYYPVGDDQRIIAGESGAAGFAGFLSLLNEKELQPVKDELNMNKNSNILFINTEGDTDKQLFNEIVLGEIEHYPELV